MQNSNERLKELFNNLDNPTQMLKAIFYRHGVDPRDGVNRLVDEITLDGANTIASIFRRWEGVPYLKIVRDAARKMKVTFSDTDDEILIERRCLESMIKRYLEKAGLAECKRVQQIFDEYGRKYGRQKMMTASVMNGMRVGTLGLLIKEIGQRATSMIVQRIIMRIMGRQMAREASKRVVQMAGFAVPLLNILMIGWTIVDIAGPAYRKTIPTVLEIALLRLEFGDLALTETDQKDEFQRYSQSI